jgi:hypothetical protein
MIAATTRQPIRRYGRTRLTDKVLIFTLLAFGFSSIFLSTAAAAGPCGPGFPELPVPAPIPPAHRVVQLINCSKVVVLGAANAAGKAGVKRTPVFPREKTWVMQPQGSANGADILTIDIPPEWEVTKNSGATTPNLWVRTGCRYDIASDRAQCETGGCGGLYDCSKGDQGPPVPATLFEWYFYEQVSNGRFQYFQDAGDISAVNGVNLNMDIQPVGGSPHDPFDSGTTIYNPQWLAENQPLTVVGADLRSDSRCILPTFRLKRSDLTGLTTAQAYGIYGSVIVDNDAQPSGGDSTVACFSNCAKYAWPLTPANGANCDDSDHNSTCYRWKAFCLNAPSAYDKPCHTDQDCTYGTGCWGNPGSPLNNTCQGRAFIKNNTCAEKVCTFPYGYINPVTKVKVLSFQPPFGHCTDVTSDQTTCIGDDTIHEVMRKAYTWPNDPEVFSGDAPLYRVVIAPGGTTAPITPSTTPLPLCSSLPDIYGYSTASRDCSVPVKDGAKFAVARPADKVGERGPSWSCNLNSSASGNDGVICRWH